MVDVRITRFPRMIDDVVRGVFLVDFEPVAMTLELPWKKNKNNISCIPAGEYECVYTSDRTTSGGLKIAETFQVMNVRGRGGILIHVGNTIKDTQGCILVGTFFGTLNNQPAVLESKRGFSNLMSHLLPMKRFTLLIEEVEL